MRARETPVVPEARRRTASPAPETAPAARSPGVRAAVLALLRGYKRRLSPLLPPACRFTPTCSEYAVLAIERHGLWRGGLATIGRLLRCQPFSPGGIDLPRTWRRG